MKYVGHLTMTYFVFFFEFVFENLGLPNPVIIRDQDEFWKFATTRWSSMAPEDITLDTLLSLADEAAHDYKATKLGS